MFGCSLCKKSFRSRVKLNLHMISHTKEKSHKCSICSATFGLASSLKVHIKGLHEGVRRKFIQKKNTHCPLCSYKCCGKFKLESHLKKHSSEKPISCSEPDCSFRTKYKICLARHIRGVHNRERLIFYDCESDGCNYKATSKSNLDRHHKVHSNQKPILCHVPGCNYTCNLKEYLKAHILRAHCEEKPWKCSLCDFRTKYKSSLKMHEDTHEKIKRFQCQAPNCSFASSVKSNLDRHVAAKHRKKSVPCTVPRCNFRCGSRAVLISHCRMHELPILKCPHGSCIFSTRLRTCLLKHISRHHADSQPPSPVLSTSRCPSAGLKTRRCSVPNCDYQTEFPHRYDRHIKTHEDEEKRKFACEFCSYRASSLCLLKLHVHRHTQEKPYSCSHCDYACVDGYSLRRHARRVHQIHVILCGREILEKTKCCTCSVTCSGYSEFVLHSMKHLKPVVVLERLRVHVI